MTYRYACTWPSCWPAHSGFRRRCHTSRRRSRCSRATPRRSRCCSGSAPCSPPRRPRPPAGADPVRLGQAEDQVSDIGQPAFAQDAPSAVTEDIDQAERPSMRLADVGGMEQVKQRLELSFLGPIRNPQLASAFGATAGGGLLLYGPPGCGKTFIARAVAGEIGARFSEFGVADVLDMWTGQQRAQPGRDLRRRPPQRPVRAVLRRGRRARPQALAPDHLQQHAQHGQPAAGRDGLAGRAQRRRLRARRHQPPVGRGQRAAPARPVRPDAAGAAAGRPGPGGDPAPPPARPAARPASTSASSPGPPSTTPGPTWRTCATPRPSGRWPTSMRSGRLVPLTTRDLLGRGPRGAAQHRAVVRHRAQRRAVRQHRRQLRRAGRLPARRTARCEPLAAGTRAAAARAEHLRALGRLDDAERVLRTALRDGPGRRRAAAVLAAVLLSARRFDEGLAASEAALAARPGRRARAPHPGAAAVGLGPAPRGRRVRLPRGHPGPGVADRGAGVLDAAAARGPAAATRPRSPAGRSSWRRMSADAHFQLADVTSDLGDRATARRAYAETLRLDPEHAAARHDLAVLDARAHRPARALAGLVTAGRLDPTDARGAAHRHRGVLAAVLAGPDALRRRHADHGRRRPAASPARPGAPGSRRSGCSR